MEASIGSILVNLRYLLLFTCLSSLVTSALGFTIDLFHRDSIWSPLRNPSKTPRERLNDSLNRSFIRARHFGTLDSRGTVWSPVVPVQGEYMVNISVGSPPVTLFGIADTGSDLTWTQCKPCVQCYNQSLPIFDPKKSSTFQPIACGPLCHSTLATSICSSTGDCSYQYSYGDESYTNGVLATETVTFGSPAHSFPGVLVGCGHDNGGTFNVEGSGLVGLGGGDLSLVSQIKFSIDKKFSYCLVPFFKTNLVGKIRFGTEALVSGTGVVSTPLVRKTPTTFYYLTLESIGIGNVNLSYKASKIMYAKEGNIIIDSGTTLTLLPEEFYHDIEAELKKNIKAKHVEDPQGMLSLCHESNQDLNVPLITVRFAEAELELQPANTFVKVQENVVCFAVIPATEVAIFGNLAQMDFLVGYDLEKGIVSFKPTNCSQLKL